MKEADQGSRGALTAGDAVAARGQCRLSVLALGHLLLAGALLRHVRGIFLDTQMGVCCHGEGSIGRVLSELLCTSQLVTVLTFAWFCRGQLEHQRAKSKFLPLSTL